MSRDDEDHAESFRPTTSPFVAPRRQLTAHRNWISAPELSHFALEANTSAFSDFGDMLVSQQHFSEPLQTIIAAIYNEHEGATNAQNGFRMASVNIHVANTRPQSVGHVNATYEDITNPLSSVTPTPSIKRPIWLWCIAILDILSIGLYTGLLCYLLIHQSERFSFAERFVNSSLVVVVGSTQGLVLHTGLLSNDASRTVSHCQLWIFLELFLLLVSSLEIFIVGIAYFFSTFSLLLDPLEIFELAFVSFYRLVAILIVKDFASRLLGLFE